MISEIGNDLVTTYGEACKAFAWFGPLSMRDMVREVHGVCRCGHGYHWSVCERKLERILERYNERKVEIRKELAGWMR